jgi:hypothetical protein
LEQKLKIALRKGHEDKVLKIKNQLDNLRSGKKYDAPIHQYDDKAIAAKGQVKVSETSNLPKVGQNSIRFSIEPSCVKNISVTFYAFAGSSGSSVNEVNQHFLSSLS